MKVRLSLLLLTLLYGGFQLSAEESNQLNEKYRRSSIAMFTIVHPADSFSTEIRQAVQSMPFPDKYDNHDIGIQFLEGTPHADRKADLSNEIIEYLRQNQIAKELVAKWFCFNGNGFDTKLIAERGLYDATVLDAQNAMNTTRGQAMLADAGEELIGKTFILINDISYVDHKERAEIVSETSRAVGETAQVVGDAANEVLGLFGDLGSSVGGLLSATGGLVNTAAGMLGDITDMLNISGFVVRINSYLFQLKWNDSIANTFYNNYYTINEPEKISAFLADTTTFQMKYIGKYEQYTDKGTMYSQKSQSEQMLVTCTRTLDKNIVNLQKKYPVFQVKTPICEIAYNDKDKFIGYRAYIGTKEGITPKSKFVVLEKQVSEDGQTFYKQVGTLKPDKNEIWDNRYMVSEEELKNNGGRPLTATLLKGTKNLMPGMLLFEGEFDAKQEKAKIAKAKKEAKAAKKKEKEQKK